MLKFVVPIDTDPSVIKEMQEWCDDNVSFDEYCYYDAWLSLDECAKFWFKCNRDAMAFKMLYPIAEKENELKTHGGGKL